MNLGHVYDLDLKKNETLIKEVIIQAQGEVGQLFSYSDTPLIILPRLDGTRGIYQTGQGDLVKLYPRPRELPK